MAKSDEDLLVECGWLNDRHINFAQRLLRSQFPEVKVLEHSYIISGNSKRGVEKIPGVQVI